MSQRLRFDPLHQPRTILLLHDAMVARGLLDLSHDLSPSFATTPANAPAKRSHSKCRQTTENSGRIT